MNFIIELVDLVIAFFRILFAIPALGILILVGTFGPTVVKAVKHR